MRLALAWPFLLAEAAPPLSPRIFFHELPACARPEEVPAAASSAEAVHLGGLLRQILAVEAQLERHRVREAEAAELFFVPARFPLLFWAEQLDCVNESLAAVAAQPQWRHRAGYDHLLLYGYEYPHWRRLPRLLLESYDPFVGNALVLTVSFWSQGRRSALLGAGLYPLLRMVLIPYLSVWDCAQRQRLQQGAREHSVAFVGSIKRRLPFFVFRERLLVAAAAARLGGEGLGDGLVIEVFPAEDEQRATFAQDYAQERELLYRSSHFCLVMPGDGNTAGRLFDVMMAGCIPVLLYHPDSYPVLPFTSRVPWPSFILAEQIATEEEAAAVLQQLLGTSASYRERCRRRVLDHAPLVALALRNCDSSTTSALDLISAELQARAQLLVPMLSGISTVGPAQKEAHWLRWGPASELLGQAGP